MHLLTTKKAAFNKNYLLIFIVSVHVRRALQP